ncbi:adhesion G-protein coupled receptor G4 [Ambystoma mexicanum]|uniref:adhesion G-protein coupled receptor G4 n=1 Tax=Ambystoma mexicanum TaxID=8296 RepID=UPI0037E913F5
MKMEATSRLLTLELLCCWLCMACFSFSDAQSLRGQKLEYKGLTQKYARLKNVPIKDLWNFTVCFDLNRTSVAPSWTAFTYDVVETKGLDFGFAGVENQLILYHFTEHSSCGSDDFQLHTWSSVCCTWNGTEMNIFINGSLKFGKSYPPNFLRAGGTLVLGYNHSNTGNDIKLDSSNNFVGSLYNFQVWDYVKFPDVPNDCSEGNIVHWDRECWEFIHISPTKDLSLRCANISVESTSVSSDTTILQSTETTPGYRPSSTHSRTSKTYATQPIVTTLSTVASSMFTTAMTSIIMSTNGPSSISTTHQVLKTTTTTKSTSSIPNTQISKTTAKTLVTGITKPTSQTTEKYSSLATSTESKRTTDEPNNILTSSSSTHVTKTSHPTQTTSITKPATSATTTQVSFYIIKMTMAVESRYGSNLNKELLLYHTSNLLQDTFKNTEFKVLRLAVTDETRSNDFPRNKPITQMVNQRRSATAPSSHDAKAILQTTSPDKEDIAMEQIHDTVKQNSNYSELSFKIWIVSVKVEHIEDPGLCPATTTNSNEKGTYKWAETRPGQRALFPCVTNTGENALRDCSISIESDAAEWKSPNLKKCKLLVQLPNNIIDLRDLIITPGNAEDFANHILNLSLSKYVLSNEEMKVILDKTSDIIQIGDIDETFGHDVLRIISAVLERAEHLREFTNRILTMIEQLGDKMTFSGREVNITAASLALAVTGLDLSLFEGVFFTVTSYLQGMEPEILMHTIPLNMVMDFIFLPGSLQNHVSSIISRIQFNFFGTTSLFQDPEMSGNTILNTYVVGASVLNNKIQNLKDPVTVTLQHIKKNTHKDPVHCAFWDFEKNNHSGGWDTSGCHLVFTNANYTTCNCTHLTHFGVLMDLSGEAIDPLNNQILTLITYVGCGISSIFLGVALVTYLALVQLRKDNPSKILMNLCTALLMLNLIFLLNNWLSSFNNYGLCISAAVLLHYFLLVSFTWMGLEAVHMYFALVKVFNVYIPNYILKFCAVGWGVPAIIVITVVIVNRDFYGFRKDVSKEVGASADDSAVFCWIQDSLVFYISVVSYFGVIFLMNISMFIVVLLQINAMKSKQQKSRKTVLHDLKSTASLTFLLGLTWGFAFFAWGPVKIGFLYLFAIANTLQGFFIFLFHCLMKENVRRQWRLHLCYGRFRLDNSSDWSKLGEAGSKQNNLARSQKLPSVGSMHYDSSHSVANGSASTSVEASPVNFTKEWSRTAHTGSVHNKVAWNQRSSAQSLKSRASCSLSNGSGSISDNNSATNLTNGGKYDNLCCMPTMKCVTMISSAKKMQLKRELEVDPAKTLWYSA